MTPYREGLPPLPAYMQHLPLDPRGFPVPWFTPWDDKEKRWRFDAADFRKLARAVKDRLCWICGGTLHRNYAFVIGPMCAVNRTTSEPPSHCECATYAAKACPFLTRPRMRRVPGFEEEKIAPGGFTIDRNPGVALVWVTRTFKPWHPPGGGVLFEIGTPIRIEAWAEGRQALPDEVSTSIETGLPHLLKLVGEDRDPDGAMRELRRRLSDAWARLKLPGAPVVDQLT